MPTPRHPAAVALGAAGLLVLAAPAFAQRPSARLEAQRFMAAAVMGDTTELKLAHLAERKAVGGRVRRLAHDVIRMHAWWHDKAAEVARQVGAPPPTGVNSQGRKQLQTLRSLSARAFDRQFVTDMVENHAHTLALSRFAAHGQGRAARFAAASLPPLRKLLDESRGILNANGWPPPHLPPPPD